MSSRTSAIDLDAYLDRIGYRGTPSADLPTLRALHRLHPQHIAFENLDPLLRRPVRLDPAALQQKLVTGGRGGYCFEQNILFRHVLEALGFRVTGLAARVLWQQPEDAVTMRTHMLLRVELTEGTYLADVGFGGLTLTAPLALMLDIEQPTPHEAFRIVRAGEGLRLQARIAEQWRTTYRFDLLEQFQIDYEISNYYLSTHPDSLFCQGLMLARPTGDGRLALLNRRFTRRRLDGHTEQRTLASAAELDQVLRNEFGVRPPADADLEAAFERLR